MKAEINKTRLDVAVGLIIQEDHIFVAQRALHDSHGGCWEFPGGKVDPGETNYDALCRELKEEIDISVHAADFFQTVDHDYDAVSVRLHVFRVTEFSGEPKGHEGQRVEWVALSALKNLTFPGANMKIIESFAAL